MRTLLIATIERRWVMPSADPSTAPMLWTLRRVFGAPNLPDVHRLRVAVCEEENYAGPDEETELAALGCVDDSLARFSPTFNGARYRLRVVDRELAPIPERVRVPVDRHSPRRSR